MFLKLKRPTFPLVVPHVAWDSLPPVAKKMHLSFESLVIIGTLSLEASLMDIHHDTSFKCILEDDSIFFII